MLLEVQTTIDECHKDSKNYSANCMYTLNKMTRWGNSMGLPLMVARDKKELDQMPHDHRHLSWYAIDQTRTVKWATAKKHRSAVYNYYERMGISEHDIPTATFRFTHRMNGLQQRKGVDSKQDRVFSDVLLEDMVALLSSDYVRARGERQIELAQVNLAFHLYTQAGLRANEAFEVTVGELQDGFCFGQEAKRKRLLPHFTVRLTQQTKENRFGATKVLCCYEAKRAPLAAGLWAEVVVEELTKAHRGHRDSKVFSTAAGEQWRMGWLWATYITPAMERLKDEKMGGLERQDLDEYGTNSFRRTWNTLAAGGPDRVSKDLRERQARWRYAERKRNMAMASLYCDPRPSEMLLPTYWL